MGYFCCTLPLTHKLLEYHFKAIMCKMPDFGSPHLQTEMDTAFDLQKLKPGHKNVMNGVMITFQIYSRRVQTIG